MRSTTGAPRAVRTPRVNPCRPRGGFHSARRPVRVRPPLLLLVVFVFALGPVPTPWARATSDGNRDDHRGNRGNRGNHPGNGDTPGGNGVPPASPRSAASSFAEGVRRKEAGDLDAAKLLLWDAILGGHPAVEEAMLHFRDCYAREGKPEAAMLFVAKEYFKRGDNVGGANFLRSALEIKPDYAEAHFYNGLVATDVASSIRHYYEAVRLAPGNGEYYYQLGTRLFEVDKNNEALVCFEQVRAGTVGRVGRMD